MSGWGRGVLGRRLVALLVAGSLAGCGSGGPVSEGDGPSGSATDGVGRAVPPSGGDPAAALAEWRSFPVTAVPRPLVLIPGAVIDPATGFGTGDAKLAYFAGAFRLATALPTAPATSGGYALVTARAALDRLAATGSHQPVSHPLRIVSVSLGQAPFGTTAAGGHCRPGDSRSTGPPTRCGCSRWPRPTCGGRNPALRTSPAPPRP